MKQYEHLKKYCIDNGIIYNETINEKFKSYYDQLIETNKVMNLTAITDQEEVELKHFIDSLAAAPYITKCLRDTENDHTYHIIDIGTGAGFPGLPLSFVFPEIEFVLADSLNKRIGFLQEVIDSLHCTNVTAIHTRAEDFGHGPQRQYFDICVSRAVADTVVLSEYCLPLVKQNGKVILYKSGEVQEELVRADYAIKELGGIVDEVRSFQLFDTDIRRTLVIVKKINDTPAKYPRKAGKPAKMPLLK